MLDIKFIRENADLVRQAIANRKSSAPIEEILKLDAERRQKVTGLEDLRRQRKEGSKQRRTDESSAEQGRNLRDSVKNLEDEVKALDEKLNALLLQVPNMPHPSVPLGESEADNKVVRTWGEIPRFDFKPKPHWELGESLGIIDFESGVKLSGTRFYVLKGLGARLQRALIAFFLNLHTIEHGYKEVYLPFMVKREVMLGSGQLPKFYDNLYHDDIDDFWFVPTAEVPITSLHRDEILSADVLPLNYVAYTPCFRREKMSAGKDVRGIKRGHQFDKVEMYKFTDAESSYRELDNLLKNATDVCEHLKIPHRVVEICTADLGFGSAKSFDIEMWAPGCEEWLEVSSCSNCADFQGRRSNIRYRPTPDAKPQFVHTLNGSGLALPRVMISIIENYQLADGSIRVPDVLQEFVGAKIIK